ncbi:hypothetical protein, partial [Leptospira levettii]|uniref:hypothetical protein n=1 Tax=Leptospira levettii TaxID=2023178 RepID=UPI0014383ACC
LILGITGIFGFVGLRDIGSIKKEYQTELAALKNLKIEFESKSKEFDLEKQKVDEEFKLIIKENQEQNNRIKVIELRDKTYSALRENNLISALEL